MTMSILTVTVLASVLATVTLSAPPVFRLASYYGDHMVLQMEPHQSIIWGYGEENSDIEVNLKEKIYTTTTYQGPDGIQWIWKITLDVMPPSGPFSIEIKHHASMTDVITLRDVLFGDVWLCGGQSNMVFSVTQAFNATMEAMLSYEYPYIRLFTVNLNESEKALYDLESVEEPWSVPSPATVSAGAFKYFSATCWFYGRNLYDHLQYPIGLLVSSYGGTPVEAWSSPDALKVCNRTELQEANNSKKSDIIEAKKNDPNWDAKFGGPGAHS
uniref:Sialate O-acetylesterase-like n=1 Tax=Saccoglossus kowalevskii TaxID=10224 RepID=A0ABM0GRV0_SACKO